MSDLEFWSAGDKVWECNKVQRGLACNFKGGTAADHGRTVLLSDDGRTRVHDQFNDVELGELEDDI